MGRTGRAAAAAVAAVAAGGGAAGPARAHVSEQGFVLLLPTEVYTLAGVAVVAATVGIALLLPARAEIFAARRRRAGRAGRPAGPKAGRMRPADWASLGSLVAMLGLIWLGLFGPPRALSNLLPLSFWTIGWIGVVTLAGLCGGLWRGLNPWTGLYRLLGPLPVVARLPGWVGRWPAVALLLGFAGFLLADVAPDDPRRLSVVLMLYWVAQFAGLLLCGPRWLRQGELGHAIFAAYGRLAPLGPVPNGAATRERGVLGGDIVGRGIIGQGVPGWRACAAPPRPGAGVFALMLLAVGSFDGLNETFWWLGQIGVNPLAYPGRSAVVGPTLLGLVLACLSLAALFGGCVWLGLRWAAAGGAGAGPREGPEPGFRLAAGWLALSLLPIALAYHVAHYLTAFLVQGQYWLAAVSDPLGRGHDLLGLGAFHVTTGFLNAPDSVRAIWLTQGGVVVLGHVWSVLLSHAIAQRLWREGRAVRRATLPLSLFMVLYTGLGLWLLAAPRGA